jgi:hypothetical protein
LPSERPYWWKSIWYTAKVMAKRSGLLIEICDAFYETTMLKIVNIGGWVVFHVNEIISSQEMKVERCFSVVYEDGSYCGGV